MFYIPTAQEIQDLQVGDLAPNSLSKEWQEITYIFGRGISMTGKWYICYYTKFGENSTISHSLVENKLDRNVRLTGKYNSHELDEIEKKLLEERT